MPSTRGNRAAACDISASVPGMAENPKVPSYLRAAHFAIKRTCSLWGDWASRLASASARDRPLSRYVPASSATNGKYSAN